MARKSRKKSDPVVERRRRLVLQWTVLLVLGAVAAVLVYKAMQMP